MAGQTSVHTTKRTVSTSFSNRLLSGLIIAPEKPAPNTEIERSRAL